MTRVILGGKRRGCKGEARGGGCEEFEHFHMAAESMFGDLAAP
jgi:hypothetical protein